MSTGAGESGAGESGAGESGAGESGAGETGADGTGADGARAGGTGAGVARTAPPDEVLALDAADPLARFRERFVFDPAPAGRAAPIYLDGNSLGRLPTAARARVVDALDREWGRDLIGSWRNGWYEAPARTGDALAPLIGAGAGEVVVSDSTSVNLYKLAAAAVAARPERPKIVTDEMNFPSDVYVLQGVARGLPGRALQVTPAAHDGIEPDLDALERAIDASTALVVLSLVTFKSGYLHDAERIARRARETGAWVLWDLSHATGAVPVRLRAWGSEMAVGCTYKYLNGGPGAPAFLYVRRDLQATLRSPLEGWFGRGDPFGFALDADPADGIGRFLVGTPPILSLSAVEAALEPVLEAGIEAIRAKSVALGELLVRRYDEVLAPLGFGLGSPRDPARRGAHVSLRHPDGLRLSRALAVSGVVPDFRDPDTLRFGLSPLTTSFAEVWWALETLRDVAATGRHLEVDGARRGVT